MIIEKTKVWLIMSKDRQFVAKGNVRNRHLVRTDGSLVYMDSLRQEIEFTTLSEINKRHYVFGLFCFCDIFTGDILFLG